jgi:2-polyprenyl-3-methyl-5-hydroxy-6-metoxy-1,4-benzoquinol methylase
MNNRKYLDANKAFWNERVLIHKRSEFYELESFRKGTNKLHDLELRELGDVTGKKILHLQCHFGMDTLSLEMLGAEVTGVDFSEEGIKAAQELRDEMNMSAKFVLSDIASLRNKLDGKFDIVFTSYGAVTWLPDIDDWGRTISHFLKDDGFFYIAEIHPASMMFNNTDKKIPPTLTYPYFKQDVPIKFEEEGTYAVKDAKTQNNVTYEFTHSLSDIIMSLINAGLRIEFLHEHPFTVWEHFPGMKKVGRYYTWEYSMPLLFSLKAVKD